MNIIRRIGVYFGYCCPKCGKVYERIYDTRGVADPLMGYSIYICRECENMKDTECFIK